MKENEKKKIKEKEMKFLNQRIPMNFNDVEFIKTHKSLNIKPSWFGIMVLEAHKY